jgi:hypothetical protein
LITWLVRDLIPANTFVIPGRLASRAAGVARE